MPTQISEVVQHLRRAIHRHDEAGLTDGQLLGRFIEQRDEAAVADLVRRHGPMVWGVCRRILRTHHDAEDAFQATFLVLVRKAGSVRQREMVGNWLFGVAHQTALKSRATAAKQFARERQVADMPEPAVKEHEVSCGLQAALDQELSRLPEKYRVGIVLCDLEGKTRKAVARQLGLPEGTLAGRLTRGRAMLAKRLAQHGLAVSGGTLAAMLSQQAASACVPTSVVSSTIKAVALVATGQAAAGMISAKALALTEGVLKAMLMSKLKAVITVLSVALGMVVFGGGLYLHQAEAQQGPPAKSPVAGQTDEMKGDAPQQQDQEQEKEGFTAWGKEVGGLQAGLGFRPGEKRAYSHGETVTLVVRVRNVGKEAIQFQYLPQFFVQKAPAVTDSAGKLVHFRYGVLDTAIVHVPTNVKLPPGKELVLAEVRLPTAALGTGKFTVQYEQVFGKSYQGLLEVDPTLKNLGTGKLELEIKSEPPPAATGQKAPEKQEKEGFTAWGKEVGGLQAGLGYRPGEKRTYSHGETVKVVIRVRNVGKEAVEFKHIWAFFFENPPTITDADGIQVQLPRGSAEGRQLPRTTNIAPGKETEIFDWEFDLRPQGESGKKLFTIHGTGKFNLQCERIVGPTSANPQDPNPALSKLATGKLELEIKTEPPKPEKEKEGFTAWGKEVGGLQAGLGFHPGQMRAYSPGETVKLVVRVRNIGKQEVKFKYVRQFFIETPPAVMDSEGKPVPLPRIRVFGFHALVEVNLAPAKEIELCELKLEPRSATQSVHQTDWVLFGTGRFGVQYEQLAHPDNDKILGKLATGKLELEIKTETKEKGFTAWGKEVGGLQAGLGFRPYEKRAYSHGERVKLVVRVRNVGKEEVKFSYLHPFFENQLTVTDGDGKPVPQQNVHDAPLRAAALLSAFAGW